MLEPEIAFADLATDAALAEALLKYVFKAVLDESGELNSIIHFAKDITEIKKLEAQFLQAQKMEAIGRLASGVYFYALEADGQMATRKMILMK